MSTYIVCKLILKCDILLVSHLDSKRQNNLIYALQMCLELLTNGKSSNVRKIWKLGNMANNLTLRLCCAVYQNILFFTISIKKIREKLKSNISQSFGVVNVKKYILKMYDKICRSEL